MYRDSDSDSARLIAVVGMAGRFPAAPDVDSFWRLLRDGGDAIGPVPPGRWDATALLDPELPIQAVGGFLDDVELFDPTFFGISPREAEDVDPQQRLMLEAAWRALEDADQPAAGLRGSRTGVYVGASWHDYELLRKDRGVGGTQHSAVGTALDVIAARVSYALGLTGPSLVVETGCSSSLVALHLAAQALRGGDIGAALVGGVNLILTPDVSIGLTHFGGLSARGRCQAFAEGADGFVRAECVAALYLKRLDAALADGDRVRGVIAASTVNNDGGGESLVTPSPRGQEDLLRRAYGDQGIPLEQLRYVEAHGTGTGRGDPIEAGVIGRVLGQPRDRAAGPLPIGSVKTNIGHTEASAGLAGLIKALLALEHRVVPPSLHAAALNPDIDFAGLNLTVAREPLPLTAGERSYIGVNSFGWGGTNAHVVLADPPAQPAQPADGVPSVTGVSASTAGGEGVPPVLPLSAHSPQALRERIRDVHALIADGAEPGEVAGALGRRRDHFAHRLAVVAPDAGSALRRLSACADGPADDIPGVVAGRPAARGRVAFVFPGQGAQWPAMGQRLYAGHATFARVIDRCAEALAPHVDWDLAKVLAGVAGTGWLSRVDMVQPVLWAMSAALAEAWREAGVTPDVVVGHSQGEIAAATVAGILSYSDAATIVARRSALAARASGRGRMLAVALGSADARAALEGFEDVVSLAVHNAPSSCVLSGDAEAVATLKELLDAEGVFCRLVDVDYASHSPQMDELTPDLLAALDGIRSQAGDIPLMSTVRVATLAGTEMDARYWADNLRQPVLFSDTMTALFDEGVSHVVEISAHPVLATPLEQLAGLHPASPRVLSTLRRDAGAPEDLALAFAAAYVSGLAPFAALPPGAEVRLPPYPWQRSRYWPAPGKRRDQKHGGLDCPLTPSQTEQDVWHGTAQLSLESQPWLDDHRVHEAAVVPATVMVTLALGAGRVRTGRVPARLSDVEFRSDLTLAGGPATIGVQWRDDIARGGSFTLRSLTADGAGWTAHASARVHYDAPGATPVPFPAALLSAPATEPAAFYAGCARRGLRYGPAFQGIHRLHVTVGNSDPGASATGQALAELTLHPRCRAGAALNNPHPALLDAALQASLAVLGVTGSDGLDSGDAGPGDAVTVVPTGIERVDVHAAPDSPVTSAWAHATARPDGRYDIHMYDESQRPLLSMLGLRLKELALESQPDPHAARLHQMRFIEAPRPSSGMARGRWLVVGARDRAGALAAALATVGLASTADLASIAGITGVAYLAPTAADGIAAQRAALPALASLARDCLTLPDPPRLAVVTADAQAVLAAEIPDPGAALFWGLTRVLRREHGELAPILVDVSGGDDDWVGQVAAELAAGADDDQVVLRGHRRLAGRIVAGTELDGTDPADALSTGQARLWRTPAQPFRLVPSRADGWEGLEFRAARRVAPGPGQVEVEVSAAALNFIDVMKAMGTYPDPADAGLLGGECAGRVTRTGEGVTQLRPGDRIVACAFGSLASHVTVDVAHVRPVPAGLSDSEAAALPLVTVTAWYGLAELARVRPGETVLVHSAAGGLGLAAIGVARHLGARVIATAGSTDKRRYLREQLGIADVFDSRDLSWAAAVAEATGGRGVDVVLNSLTGAAIELGMAALADDGRFIEVGKKDIYADRTVTLGAFRKGISLAAVDLAGLMRRRPEYFGQLLAQAWNLVRDGKLPLLPVLAYPFAAAPEALREMAQGAHTGKFVLTDPGSVPGVAPEPLPGGQFRPDGTYLITGGLGALGMSLAEFIAARGGGALALLGRTAPGEAAAQRVAALRAAGVEVRTYQADVTDRAALAQVLADAGSALPPLRGVVHAAGLLDDATIATLRPDQVERVISPKVDGALALDELTAGVPLDFFLLFSSAAALVGNAGQAAYAAGNAFLDALAVARRRRGLPGLSVQWGPFADAGLAAADGNRGERLAERGMGSFPAQEAWEALTRLLGTHGVIAYVPIDVRRWFDAYPDTAALPSWRLLRDSGGSADGLAGADGFAGRLREAAPEARKPLTEEKIREVAGRVLRLDPSAITPDIPFKELGLDSLMGLEMRNRLENAFGLKLSPTLLWTFGTVDALATVLCERLV